MTDDELLRLARKATPGKWHHFCKNGVNEIQLVTKERGNVIVGWTGFDGASFPAEPNAAYIAAANPSAIIALIERHRAERAEWDAHAGQWKVTLDEQRAEVERLRTDWDNHRRQISGLIVETYELRAEVERLTRERDEARQENQYLRDEKAVLDTAIKCAHSDELTAVAMQQNAEHLRDVAEAALSAAQKRIAELEELERDRDAACFSALAHAARDSAYHVQHCPALLARIAELEGAARETLNMLDNLDREQAVLPVQQAKLRAALAGRTAGDGEQVTQQQRPVGRSTEE